MDLIATFDDEFGQIKILKSRAHGSHIFLQGGYCQTEADQNGISLAPYVHAIYGMLVQSKARNVLMIGCGGGSLGTMLVKAGLGVTIVDENPASFQISRDYFGLPQTIDCHVVDGEEFLLATQHCYDAIVMDAYNGSCIPHHLRTRNFFYLVNSHLDQSCGCLFANIYVTHSLDGRLGDYAEAVGDVWSDVRVLDTPSARNQNAVLMAGHIENVKKPVLLKHPMSGSQNIELTLSRMNFGPLRY